MVLKEYRICLPMSVEEYKIGQLYTIARHSYEQSQKGEGVQIITNDSCSHSEFGVGTFTEKYIHLFTKLPEWIQNFIPQFFYLIEKSWNYYPYTETKYSCSFLPNFTIDIKTSFQNDNGNHNNLFSTSSLTHEIDFIDIRNDVYPEKHFKICEDLKFFVSQKTGRGPLTNDWRNTYKPIMCSYKLVDVKFEFWGLQNKLENYIHNVIRDILLVNHGQAFVWIDEWYEMTFNEVLLFEEHMYKETNQKFFKFA